MMISLISITLLIDKSDDIKHAITIKRRIPMLPPIKKDKNIIKEEKDPEGFVNIVLCFCL